MVPLPDSAALIPGQMTVEECIAVAEAGLDGPAGPALGPSKGIGDKRGSEASNDGGLRLTRCERWPDWLALRSTLDDLVRGRCKATDLCDYCARMAARENTELLHLDATQGVAPMVWCVLGTGTDA